MPPPPNKGGPARTVWARSQAPPLSHKNRAGLCPNHQLQRTPTSGTLRISLHQATGLVPLTDPCPPFLLPASSVCDERRLLLNF